MPPICAGSCATCSAAGGEGELSLPIDCGYGSFLSPLLNASTSSSIQELPSSQKSSNSLWFNATHCLDRHARRLENPCRKMVVERLRKRLDGDAQAGHLIVRPPRIPLDSRGMPRLRR